MPSSPLSASDPTELGPYVLVGRLGVGGMGTVYLARRQGSPDSLVALKVIRQELAADVTFRRRFAREVQLSRQLSGPYVARIVEAETEGATQWIATEYIPGPTLAEELTQSGPIGGSRLTDVAKQLSQAVSYAHSQGVTHRDLKPANVILGPDGLRLLDFGIAQAADATALTGTGLAIGSPAWMAPEELNGQPVTPAVDVWGTAALLVYAATGRHPFGQGRAEALAYRILSTDPDLTGTPDWLQAIAAAALSADPTARPTSAQVADRIQTVSTGEGDRTQEIRSTASTAVATSAIAHPEGETELIASRDRSPRHRRNLLWTLIAVVAIALLATTGYAAGIGPLGKEDKNLAVPVETQPTNAPSEPTPTPTPEESSSPVSSPEPSASDPPPEAWPPLEDVNVAETYDSTIPDFPKKVPGYKKDGKTQFATVRVFDYESWISPYGWGAPVGDDLQRQSVVCPVEISQRQRHPYQCLPRHLLRRRRP